MSNPTNVTGTSRSDGTANRPWIGWFFAFLSGLGACIGVVAAVYGDWVQAGSGVAWAVGFGLAAAQRLHWHDDMPRWAQIGMFLGFAAYLGVRVVSIL